MSKSRIITLDRPLKALWMISLATFAGFTWGWGAFWIVGLATLDVKVR